ncbi:hypothetical protein BDV98DRAFT_549203 [Pterulicium gracile]|uniref:AhpD-like protein n=1 Tax=Pterulicium gracile TaxID=1884261 RepID=A0A5C3QIC1_9AGAR|nr:hypothetical protein BDV98DRAFT_549203 [Pterula gracilis]
MSIHPPTIATSEYIERLRNKYTFTCDSPEDSSWYIIAAVAFSASNRPEEVAALFTYLVGLPEFQTSETARRKIARRLREALFKSGITSGYSRVINALVSLHEVTPDELKGTTMIREVQSIEEHARIGEDEFHNTYGGTAASTQKLLDDIYPDLGFFSNTIAYGLVYTTSDSTQSIPTLTPVEMSYVLVTSLISVDTPRQAAWHLDGARRRGATIEEVEKVRKMAMEVAGRCGVVWRDGVPNVNKGDLT